VIPDDGKDSFHATGSLAFLPRHTDLDPSCRDLCILFLPDEIGVWELSPTRRGQRLLKIDHDLLTHSEKPLLGTVEIGDQGHDRREREDEREERQ